MRETVSDKVQVKAAGGVRTLDAILPVIDAGCTRVGATATATILNEFERRQSGGMPTTAPTKDTTGY
jgi:deoxyribose-phosphate aldolase